MNFLNIPVSSAGTLQEQQQRRRSRYVIEDTKGVYNIYNNMQQQQQKKNKSVPLPPGNVVYSNDFLHLWSKIVAKEDEDELSIVLLRFLERITRTLTESHDDKIKMMAPPKGIEYYRSICGLNHQARDFLRAALLRLVDQLEKNSKFVKFLSDNQFLTQEVYQDIAKKLELKHNELIQEEKKKSCSRPTQEDLPSSVIPKTSGCEECEKEGTTEWIGLRLRITCGHVGCDDSSKGMHATKHFVNTGHPVIVALPDKPWKWCYIDKSYG